MEICFIVVMLASRREGSSEYSASHMSMRNWLNSVSMVADGWSSDGVLIMVSAITK